MEATISRLRSPSLCRWTGGPGAGPIVSLRPLLRVLMFVALVCTACVGLLSDGSVAVIDRASEEVRVFGADGRHLVSMGRSGEGPGEFRSAWFLWVLPGDTLWVGDYRPWRYNVFTRDGQFVRAVQMTLPYGNPSRVGGGGQIRPQTLPGLRSVATRSQRASVGAAVPEARAGATPLDGLRARRQILLSPAELRPELRPARVRHRLRPRSRERRTAGGESGDVPSEAPWWRPGELRTRISASRHQWCARGGEGDP